MKRASGFCLAFLLCAATSSTLSAQQSVYMLVDSIKGDQPAPHIGEFKLSSFSAATTNNVAVGGASGGMTAGKATFAPVKVSMRFSPASSASFGRNVATGAKLPSIEIRFYNSTNRMFYKTVYENAVLTNVATEASDEASQQIDFVFSKVKWFASPDAAGMAPPVQIGCWDLVLFRGC